MITLRHLKSLYIVLDLIQIAENNLDLSYFNFLVQLANFDVN